MGIAMVARERRYEYILRAKKDELTTNTYATSNRFFLFSHTPTHACARNSQTTLVFQNV
jgi:hypothetical protein